ncbi:MAG: hypothetical protein LBR12_00170 [Opitutaceae bacterium]|jgi:hypothetical protein|nr:hypothetical protein [Opitutaceae bacterium]
MRNDTHGNPGVSRRQTSGGIFENDAEEEASLMRLNRLFAKAAPKAARENAAALARFRRELAASIQRAR